MKYLSYCTGLCVFALAACSSSSTDDASSGGSSGGVGGSLDGVASATGGEGQPTGGRTGSSTGGQVNDVTSGGGSVGQQSGGSSSSGGAISTGGIFYIDEGTGGLPADWPSLCADYCATGCENRCEVTCPDAVEASEKLGCMDLLKQAFDCTIEGVATGEECSTLVESCAALGATWLECVRTACTAPENDATCNKGTE